MLKPETIEWVRKQKARGYSNQQLTSYLRNEGNNEQDIKDVLGTYEEKKNRNILAIVLGITLAIVLIVSVWQIVTLKKENNELEMRVVAAEDKIVEYENIIKELQTVVAKPRTENVTEQTVEEPTTQEEQKETETPIMVTEINPLYFPNETIEWTLPNDLNIEMQILNNKDEETYIGGKITCYYDTIEYELTEIDCKYYGAWSMHYIKQTLNGLTGRQGEYNCVLQVYDTDSDCKEPMGNLREKQFDLSVWPE